MSDTSVFYLYRKGIIPLAVALPATRASTFRLVCSNMGGHPVAGFPEIIIADSYEMGSQNWTDGFEQRFEAEFGYNPVKYLPVLSGRMVSSVEESDRFLWDLRRVVSDDVAYEYVGRLKQVQNEHNLKLWLECYGHWGFPSGFLMYGGQSDLVGGEFWIEGTLGNTECKSASSAAHMYGKPVISAEAFTVSGLAYSRHPATLKARGDGAFVLPGGMKYRILALPKEALDFLGVEKDVEIDSDIPVLWTHRTLPVMEIYFLSNQSREEVSCTPSFRITGHMPQLWDAVTGDIRILPELRDDGRRTDVPVKMAGLGG
jgi:hypothetical protein